MLSAAITHIKIIMEHSDIPVASHQYESIYINCPSDKVWGMIRNFQLDQMCPEWVREVTWVEGEPGKVGSSVKLTFQEGAQWTYRILEVSDIRRTLAYELVMADPASNMTAYQAVLKVFKETINNKAFVIWETDFSNDAKAEVIMDNKYKKVDALNMMARTLSE